MIDRNINFVLRHGELPTDTTTTNSWVGGSPVGINSNGQISAIGTAAGLANAYIGVAWHSQKEDSEHESLSTVVFAPAIITIKKGTNEPIAPWRTGAGISYAPGTILTPTIVTQGGINYAVWTPATTPGVYPARVLEVEGDSANPTALTILLGTFTYTP